VLCVRRQTSNKTTVVGRESGSVELLRTRLVEGDPPVLQVEGEMDLSTAEQLRAAMDEALGADPKVVVDLSGVTFCDAGGLRAILQVAAALNGAGPLTLLNASRVRWLLDMVGLSDLRSIVIRDEDEARDG
jgi:anti-anti-sigma factor